MTGIKDGLASLEKHAETFSGTTFQGANVLLAGSVDVPTVYDNTGSPYAVGNVLTAFTTETVISGGMWVTVSGAAGGASVLARAAATDSTPLGVALATVGSNAVVSILTRGMHYFGAEVTLVNAETFGMGGGAALNTINVNVSGATGGLTNSRGVVLAGASSGGQALVYLW